jgi:hypothetical protein
VAPSVNVRGIQSEKVDEVEQEKQRRTMGKEMAATREQMEKEKRLREYALMKKEKQAQKLELESLRAEIAKDKAERKARGGKLNSVLGKDGYNPSGMSAQISADIEGGAADSGADAGAGVASSSSSAKPAAAPVVTNEEAVDQAIETISRYKVRKCRPSLPPPRAARFYPNPLETPGGSHTRPKLRTNP